MDTNSWSLELAEARRAERDTQEEAGAKLGISRAHVANLELGRKRPSVDVALAVQEIYGVAVRKLRRPELERRSA